jgi:hypothetical protein
MGGGLDTLSTRLGNWAGLMKGFLFLPTTICRPDNGIVSNAYICIYYKILQRIFRPLLSMYCNRGVLVVVIVQDTQEVRKKQPYTGNRKQRHTQETASMHFVHCKQRPWAWYTANSGQGAGRFVHSHGLGTLQLVP